MGLLNPQSGMDAKSQNALNIGLCLPTPIYMYLEEKCPQGAL